MTPRLIAFYEGEAYARMARVLAYTAAVQCAGWDLQVNEATLFTEKDRSIEQRVRRNNSKLLHWAEAVDEAPDGTPMLLIDCDVMIVRSLDDIWARDFDIAYTKRDRERTVLPLNAGVVFVRATAAARRFLHDWYQATKYFKRTHEGLMLARKKYGACDQAGLAFLLDSKRFDARILALPCQEWNCEDSEWGRYGQNTRIVHIKGSLRKAIFNQPISQGRKSSVLPLARRWKEFEHEACA